MNLVNVDLSCAEHIPFGEVVANLYYRNKSLLELAPGRTGYPHNGGQHSLRVFGDRGDIDAWLSLVVQAYPKVVKEVMLLRDALTNWKAGDGRVVAAKLFSQQVYDYHESYTYQMVEGCLHFTMKPEYEYRQFILESLSHLAMLGDDETPVHGIYKDVTDILVSSTDTHTQVWHRILQAQGRM